jgi:hypothetical protein
VTDVDRGTPVRSQPLPALASRVLGSRIALWSAFVLVHLQYGLVNLYSPSNPMGDVRYVYAFWMDQALGAGYWEGIDGPWVYPVLALVPMLLARLAGAELYPSAWLGMVLVLDAVALSALTGWGRRGRPLAAGWWWTLFLLLLGPIAFARIDAVSVSLVMVGLVLLARHPRVAALLLTVAAWIKVWPAAVLAAAVIALRERLLVLGVAVATSGAVIALALAFGAGTNVMSFVTEQTGRGLQIEAPISTIWMWLAAAKDPGTSVYYDADILTFQVTGPGTDVVSTLVTAGMVLAAVLAVVLAVRSRRRGADPAALLPLSALGVLGVLIVFNKVGSPQYIAWLAAPVVAAILAGGTAAKAMRLPAVLVLAIALLTQLVYPYLYGAVIAAQPAMVTVLTLRNALLVVLLGVTIALLARLPARPAPRKDPLE